MAGPLRGGAESRPARLRCNECGKLFGGRAWFDRVTRAWSPRGGGARGNRCPRCGSRRSRLLGLR
jgi:DNA-directed RNA polymerase subunit RPC12/RpoP